MLKSYGIFGWLEVIVGFLLELMVGFFILIFIRDGKLEDWLVIIERKWEEVGKLSYIYILFFEC